MGATSSGLEESNALMSTRAPRPNASAFDPEDLAAKLEPFAKVRVLPWRWDASDYTALSRNAQPCVKGLAKRAAPLKQIISEAKTGFPSMPNLRDTILKLHNDHGVLGQFPSNVVFKEATEVSLPLFVLLSLILLLFLSLLLLL